jgi:hypothetical protein
MLLRNVLFMFRQGVISLQKKQYCSGTPREVASAILGFSRQVKRQPVRGKQNTNPTRSISTEAWGKNMKEVARNQSSCNKKEVMSGTASR